MNRVLSHQHESALGGVLEQLLETVGLSHQWTEFLIHFLTDTINLFFILFTVMFAVSLLQTYIPFEKLKDKLARLSSFWGYLLALVLGVASPFCSCTVIPVVMGLITVGVPTPVALCYLSSAALLSGGTVIALFSAMGAGFGVLYTVLAAAVAVLTSLLIRPFLTGQSAISYTQEHHHEHDEHCHHADTHKPISRVGYCLENVWHVFQQTWVYMILSIALSSLVISFVPVDLLNSVIGQQNLASPLIAALVGAPLHADAFTILPLLRLLQPINPSAALAFALGGLAISVPEVVLLSRVFRGKTIAAYAGIITALAVAAGYVAMLVG